jgi:hypothetical protein
MQCVQNGKVDFICKFIISELVFSLGKIYIVLKRIC